MTCCWRCSTAMSYCGDYRQTWLLTGHFITVNGREKREKREKKGVRDRKREREVRKTQLDESAGESSADLLWQDGGTESLDESTGNKLSLCGN